MSLPVVIIGAGPQGLAAAAHLLARGLEPLVLEQGDGPAAAVAEWGHVRLFSEWPELIDSAAARLLASTDWIAPSSGYPTGADWISDYLAPLAAALGDRVRFGTRVTGVGRMGRDLVVDSGRAEQPFIVHVRGAAGEESRIEAWAVIDASGTWAMPNPAGADGMPALGEQSAKQSGMLTHRIPSAHDAAEFAGGHVIVVGNGHSASTAIITLAEVAQASPAMRISWVLRRGEVGGTFGGGDADELPACGALGLRAKAAVEDGTVALLTGFRVERVVLKEGRAMLVAEDGRTLEPADRLVVLTGFRPDLSFLSEVRLDLDFRLQAVRAIAADVDPNVHSCGSVRATGAVDLAQPEPGFFIVGAKSYGRAPTFLAMTGYEQVRSVAAELAGDHEAAARVELVLPDTGVCGGSGVFDEADGSDAACCSATSCTPVSAAVEIDGRRSLTLLG